MQAFVDFFSTFYLLYFELQHCNTATHFFLIWLTLKNFFVLLFGGVGGLL